LFVDTLGDAAKNTGNASYPRRRVSSTPQLLDFTIDASEYWIVRRSLSSGGHSADPVADDDGFARGTVVSFRLRSGRCGKLIPLRCDIGLPFRSRELDTEFDRLPQARSHEIGSRAIPQSFQPARIDVFHPAAQDDGRLR
jgi:hypothetical protein